MKEFGSDFHYIKNLNIAEKTIEYFYPTAIFYALGRHALLDLYLKSGWKRLWVPEYFCYDVLDMLKREGVNLEFYKDYPLADDEKTIRSLRFSDGDALLRMNFFGLRSWRSNKGIPVPVIEDHTHDLIGHWAENSDADWCIASLRKTLPLAEGGVLWSPKNHKLQGGIESTIENEMTAEKRWSAMRKKTMYLNDEINNKESFRTDMITTEESFNKLEISALDGLTSDFLKEFDVVQWYNEKKRNWGFLSEISDNSFKVLQPEREECNPFSMTLLFREAHDRNLFRDRLIASGVYPAILWTVLDSCSKDVKEFSNKMLSLHCDSRYNAEDVIALQEIIAGR